MTNPNSEKAQVVSRFGQHADIVLPDGSIKHVHIRKKLGTLVTGDWVTVESTTEGDAVITATLPRTSVLERAGNQKEKRLPFVSNVDQMFIVVAAEPKFTEKMINRYLIGAELASLEAVILFNKADLLSRPNQENTLKSLELYKSLGYPILYTSALSGDGIRTLKSHLIDKTSVFVGLSGVGKSSLIQWLLPNEDLKTQALSNIEQGQHTTTVARLYNLDEGGQLIDSPGVRQYDIANLSKQELEQGFSEFADFIGRCKFRDCKHSQEPGCAIQVAVENNQISKARYQHYCELLKDFNLA